ncbi:MAG: hypothetical protein IKM46_05125 [Clostridia bacterium]|nr:hypothetical protein [Clostridia bacterium]
MELDLILSVSTCLAGIACLIYCKASDAEVSFLRVDFYCFFSITAFSGVIGMAGAVLGRLSLSVFPSLSYLLPLFSSVTSTGAVLLFGNFIKEAHGRTVKCASLVSALFAILVSTAFFEKAMGTFFVLSLVSAVIYLTFASLLFEACGFLVPSFREKTGKLYPKIMILTSLMGFAAEGFKGIFEKLFT